MIKGNRSQISDGTTEKESNNGSIKDWSKFLKNSISSNKFISIPKEKKIRIVLIKILK